MFQGGAPRGAAGAPLADQESRVIRDFCDHYGLQFHDPQLLKLALTHRSYLHVSGQGPRDSNERLEFLGDSVLGLVTSEFLYRAHPNEHEGQLTKTKSLLVSKAILSRRALAMGLGRFVLMSHSEIESGGRQRLSILADAFESVVGAVYLDQGFEASRAFIERWLLRESRTIAADKRHTNYKSHLQEYVQSAFRTHPVYRIRSEMGPDHSKQFSVEVMVGRKVLGEGKGRNKKEAEQAAARDALDRVGGPSSETRPRRRASEPPAPEVPSHHEDEETTSATTDVLDPETEIEAESEVDADSEEGRRRRRGRRGGRNRRRNGAEETTTSTEATPARPSPASVEPRSESRPEPRRESRAEPRPEPRRESRAESRPESRRESRAEPRQESRPESRRTPLLFRRDPEPRVRAERPVELEPQPRRFEEDELEEVGRPEGPHEELHVDPFAWDSEARSRRDESAEEAPSPEVEPSSVRGSSHAVESMPETYEDDVEVTTPEIEALREPDAFPEPEPTHATEEEATTESKPEEESWFDRSRPDPPTPPPPPAAPPSPTYGRRPGRPGRSRR